MTGDPVARLKAGLDADEAAAKAVTFRSHFMAIGNSVQSPGGPGHPPMPIADVIDTETAGHIARQDPARVLREVAAHREILDKYEAAEAAYREARYRPYDDSAPAIIVARDTWRQAVLALAAVYGDDGT